MLRYSKLTSTCTRNNGVQLVISLSTVVILTVLLLSNEWRHLNTGLGTSKDRTTPTVWRADNETDEYSYIDRKPLLDLESKQLSQCHSEYKYIKIQQQIGLTEDDYARSRAYHGSIRRLALFLEKLQSRQQPVSVVSYGGSISEGHGIEPSNGTYSIALVDWLNEKYPIISNASNSSDDNMKHTLYQHSRHGANICYVAKHFNFFDVPTDTDLFLLEFAVNDFSGKDDGGRKNVDQLNDVFFLGYEAIATCAEAVVRKILMKYPNAAVVFLEFRSAAMNRKTAQLLHTGVAQHYQVPIISYADAVFPKFWNLLRQLNQSEFYTIPNGTSFQPYPFGCHECQVESIDEQFRRFGCQSACDFWAEAGFIPTTYRCSAVDIPPGRVPCYSPFFTHDSVHPSWFGHQVARDLLIELLAVTSQEICQEKNKLSLDNSTVPSYASTNYILQRYGFYASEKFLAKQTDFVLVQTTDPYRPHEVLTAVNKSDGFTLSSGEHGGVGWYSNSTAGGEYVEFEFNLTIDKCYTVYLAGIKSYERFGKYTITMTDLTTQTVTNVEVDGLWEPRISVPSDTQINDDKEISCTGKCKLTILSHPEVPGRDGNQIKITDLAVRHCATEPTDEEQNDDPAAAKAWIAL